MKCTACGQNIPKIPPDQTQICGYCLKEFFSDTGRLRKYCSAECRWKGAAVEWYLERKKAADAVEG